MNILTNISRILVGILFIISGLIKANDPLGFSYKLDEYFVVFHTEFLSSLSVYMAMFICVLEVGLGVATLLGTRMKQVALSLLILITFFTFLTFYSAYFNKVTDCGCFGDAVKLTPWQSFSKDVVLFIFIGIIFVRRNSISSVINEKLTMFITVLSFILTAWFTVHCFNHLPLKDFRPYAIGTNMPEAMTLPEGAKKSVYETKLFYEKNGEVKEFTTDNYPWNDSTWTWKETKSILVVQGDEPHIHDFKMMDADKNDHAQEILGNPEYNFILVAYDLAKTDRKVQAQINQFARHCEEHKINFIGLTGSDEHETDVFRHDVEAMYDYYFCDATALKTFIRSNPGLVLMKGGVVIEMWHHNDFPDYWEFSKKYLKK